MARSPRDVGRVPFFASACRQVRDGKIASQTVISDTAGVQRQITAKW
jgi:hypothetical protein